MPPMNPVTRYVLQGRVVTMDAADTVLDSGKIYVDNGRLAAVLPSDAPFPAGFAAAPIFDTQGTLYPGLMDLHNHLSYDALPMWSVPKKFTNREQWRGLPDYRKMMSGPMNVLGKTPGYVEAIVRYVECKCLFGGVTTAQGIALFSNAGIQKYYHGVMRNAEAPDAADLPAAGTSIADVEAASAVKFLAALKKKSCLLLHLSEGTDAAARAHFQALQTASGKWAITPALAGIHCVGLQPDDFAVMQRQGAAMVWSPLSNLLLYGQTADIQAAKANGLRIALGADWTPSGSKNLLGELKVARLVSAAQGGVFSDKDLVAMATRNAAEILRWNKSLGSLEKGKRADLLVIAKSDGDPYAALLETPETGIALVIIDGTPRYGAADKMAAFGAITETRQVGGRSCALNLNHPQADPVIGALTLEAAMSRLQDGMRRLPELALNLEHPPSHREALTFGLETPQWFLVLDHDEPMGTALRPHLPFGPQHRPTGTAVARAGAAKPLSQIVQPMTPDALTVADDPHFLPGLAAQPNLPDFVKQGLPALY